MNEKKWRKGGRAKKKRKKGSRSKKKRKEKAERKRKREYVQKKIRNEQSEGKVAEGEEEEDRYFSHSCFQFRLSPSSSRIFVSPAFLFFFCFALFLLLRLLSSLTSRSFFYLTSSLSLSLPIFSFSVIFLFYPSLFFAIHISFYLSLPPSVRPILRIIPGCGVECGRPSSASSQRSTDEPRQHYPSSILRTRSLGLGKINREYSLERNTR